MHEYIVLEVPEGTPFGISLLPGAHQTHADGPILYFQVDDPASIVEQAILAGGKKRLGPKRFPGYGVIWQVEDPDGNRFGLYSRQPVK